MRRVLRHFFTLCSALSLLLCVAVGVLWVSSHVVDYMLTFRSAEGHGVRVDDRSRTIGVSRGFIVVLDELHTTAYADTASAAEFLGVVKAAQRDKKFVEFRE